MFLAACDSVTLHLVFLWFCFCLLQDSPCCLLLTSSSIPLYCTSQWDYAGRLVAMDWSLHEDLICVQDDGSVMLYDIHGQFKRMFSMGAVRDMSQKSFVSFSFFPFHLFFSAVFGC